MKNFIIKDINPSFIKNKKGEDIGVFLDIKDYNLLMDQLEDLFLGKIAKKIKDKKEDSKSLEELEKEVN
jgi:hypothetical protein